jgi:hypothetical protein
MYYKQQDAWMMSARELKVMYVPEQVMRLGPAFPKQQVDSEYEKI